MTKNYKDLNEMRVDYNYAVIFVHGDNIVLNIVLYKEYPNDDDIEGVVNEIFSDEEFGLTEIDRNDVARKIVTFDELYEVVGNISFDDVEQDG